ncbi:amino acid ABC transporter permease [Hansschlegelia beijingensis]|uniref:Polar amino acid transport system permease protein n=1 Tax=Hansschlegelia beijingensis TaxID=1133344 RepID=A0A7W6CWR4_9HYPH|nr:amino acid ABC transporter permease [Hansschlegelia beijingensis]MBB3971784.1 polar amino acid transport system permease protein [Hansschlegelia beijingensis]
MDLLAEWARSLYETTGINLSYIYDPWDRARFLSGLWMTIYLSVVGVIFSLIIGAVGAWAQSSPLAPVRWLVNAFVTFFRNTPPLVQILFFYFGLSPLLPRVEDPDGMMQPLLSSVQWAIIALSLFAGAFNIEIFRSGIEAVPNSTKEAGEALGYTRLGVYRHIVLPLALRVCLPALNNNLVNLLKVTSLAYAIAVPELLYVCKQIWTDRQNVPEMMITLLVVYVLLVGVLVWGMHRWERALAIPGYGQGGVR